MAVRMMLMGADLPLVCLQVNWPTLWLKWHEREMREAIVLPFIVGIMLIPIGLFSGASFLVHACIYHCLHRPVLACNADGVVLFTGSRGG